MRQQIWDVAGGITTIDWPEHATAPGPVCEQLGYHQELVLHTGTITLGIYQWPQGTKDSGGPSNERRYLVVLTMAVGYEIIGARDLKGLLLALKTLEPLLHFIGTPIGESTLAPLALT